MRKWFELLKLGVFRLRSTEDYQALQTYIAAAAVDEIEARGIKFSDSRVLELGAGLGGYSLVLNQRAKDFVASDIQNDGVFDKLGIPFTRVDVTQQFPFEDDSWDIIYCSSLIEHLVDPRLMVRECWRVLRPGGWLYLSFPPFYSLSMVGGHSFKPFHFLGEHLAVWLTNLVHQTQYRDYASCYGNWGLYPLTIDQVKLLILEKGFDINDIYTRMTSLNTAQLPGILKDLLTWHACFLTQKPFMFALTR